MQVCTSCNIDYEDDKRFCNYCGSPLTPKTESAPAPKKASHADEEKSEGKLFCPQCKITYEFGSSCIQCGSPLGRQTSSQEKNELPMGREAPSEEKTLPPAETSEKQKSGTPHGKLICPTCKIIYEHGTSCVQCESVLVPQTSPQANGEPEISNGSKVDETRLQTQTLEEQLAPEVVVEAPRKKLICPSCKIIYERGTSCVRCGAGLVSQTPTKEKEKPKSPEPEPDPLPLEPDGPEATFNLTFHEGMGKSSNTGSHPPPSESDGLEDLFLPRVSTDTSGSPDRKPAAASKQPSPSSPKRNDADATERGKKKELRVTPPMELSLEEQFLQAQSPDQAVARKSADVLGKTGAFLGRFKKDYRRLGLEAGSIMIMVLAGGYLLWSVFSYFTKPKPAEPRAPISKEVALQKSSRPFSQPPSAALAGEPGESKNTEDPAPLPREAAAVPPSLPEPSKPSSPEAQEAGRIKNLLENVRQSNMKKDIDLFVSCYASDFENMETRKRATLAYWEKFNYLDLVYDVRDLSISVETAKAKVEWLIKTSLKSGGQYQENKSVLDVAFKKEDGKWRIKEVKPTR